LQTQLDPSVQSWPPQNAKPLGNGLPFADGEAHQLMESARMAAVEVRGV